MSNTQFTLKRVKITPKEWKFTPKRVKITQKECKSTALQFHSEMCCPHSTLSRVNILLSLKKEWFSLFLSDFHSISSEWSITYFVHSLTFREYQYLSDQYRCKHFLSYVCCVLPRTNKWWTDFCFHVFCIVLYMCYQCCEQRNTVQHGDQLGVGFSHKTV